VPVAEFGIRDFVPGLIIAQKGPNCFEPLEKWLPFPGEPNGRWVRMVDPSFMDKTEGTDETLGGFPDRGEFERTPWEFASSTMPFGNNTNDIAVICFKVPFAVHMRYRGRGHLVRLKEMFDCSTGSFRHMDEINLS
jgi:hypothetical protein